MEKLTRNELQNLLTHIENILSMDDYLWFHDELAVLLVKRILFEKDAGNSFSAVTVKEYGSIEKYLRNRIVPILNYSFIKEDLIRYKLERDCIEMGKYALSYYENKISFTQICVYAHFQAEDLLEYFYKINKYDKLGESHSEYWSRITNKNIKFIQYGSQLKSFYEEYFLDHQIYYNLIWISKIRNASLHGPGEIEVAPEDWRDANKKFFYSKNFIEVYRTLRGLSEHMKRTQKILE